MSWAGPQPSSSSSASSSRFASLYSSTTAPGSVAAGASSSTPPGRSAPAGPSASSGSRSGSGTSAYSAQPPRRTRTRQHTGSSNATQGSAASTAGGAPDPSRMPLNVQERAVVEDLLYVLMGIEGSYITYHPLSPLPLADLDNAGQAISAYHLTDAGAAAFFDMHAGLDASVSALAARVLPLAVALAVIDAYSATYARFAAGFVNHAVCGALRSLAKEAGLLVVQLETEARERASLGLHAMWAFLAPSAGPLRVAAEVCLAIHARSKAFASAVGTRSGSLADLAAAAAAGAGSASSSSAMLGLDFNAPKTTPAAGSSEPVEWYHKGGGILGLLTDVYTATSGDPTARGVHAYLLRSASAPFLRMLRTWLHRGKIDDQYAEFMVVARDNVTKATLVDDYNDKYWDSRYEIRRGAVPPWLQPVQDMVLCTGKYLNVVAECGGVEDDETLMDVDAGSSRLPPAAVVTDVARAVDGSGAFLAEIHLAYRHANRQLLSVLVRGHALIPRLLSLKHYMLLDIGDWFDHFLDVAAGELAKPWDKVRLDKVQSMLDLALRNPASVTCRDAYKEQVRVAVEAKPLVDQLVNIASTQGMPSSSFGNGSSPMVSAASPNLSTTSSAATAVASGLPGPKVQLGMHALVLRHTIPFPLSLVFSRRAMVKYEMVFRTLVQFKSAERTLAATWVDAHHPHLARARRVLGSARNPGYSAASAAGPLGAGNSPLVTAVLKQSMRLATLRMRMLALVQAMAAYAALDVIEPNHARLEAEVRGAETVDAVLTALHAFFDECFKNMFLTNVKLLRIHARFIDGIQRFARHCDAFNDLVATLASTSVFGATNGATPPAAAMERVLALDRAISKTDQVWEYHVRLFLETLKIVGTADVPQLLVLVNRLDMNQFYESGGTGATSSSGGIGGSGSVVRDGVLVM
ncbi:Spc98 family-domain-containing protein [Blastocladiella britannica]|nr:Spc98 family-domain-containing protein [Blastocladiella britannica]